MGPVISGRPFNSGYIIASSGAASAVSSGTAETQLASITIPAGVMGTNGLLRVWTRWSFTNSGNNKSMRVRLGGSSGTAYMLNTSTTTATLRAVTEIQNANATNAQVGVGSASSMGTSSSTTSVTSAVDTTAATSIYISGQTATGGETITLLGYTVELIPGV